MIKFFRSIRKSLLMENKTGKYFKYAVGEIILVVIGILIALSINNWNENRKNSIKEIQFLKSFKVDLLANKVELNRVIEKTENTSKSSDSILRYKRGELESLSLYSFMGCMMDATGFTVYITQEGTIKDILGSGNLGIIKNDSIRLAIGSWQANLKTIREYEKIDKNETDIYFNYITQHIDLYKAHDPAGPLPLNDEIIAELFNDRVFLNHISSRFESPFVLNELYKKEVPKLDRLLIIIDNELENH